MKGQCLLLLAAAMLLASSCKNEGVWQDSDSNKLIVMEQDTVKGMQYLLCIQVGHLSSECKGGCYTINGVTAHRDCMGYGHVCSRAAAAMLCDSAGIIFAVTTDTVGLTNEDFFNMPARSLSTGEGGNNAYLNIPAQLVERDTATLQFTFTGLFYTNKPEYNNF